MRHNSDSIIVLQFDFCTLSFCNISSSMAPSEPGFEKFQWDLWSNTFFRHIFPIEKDWKTSEIERREVTIPKGYPAGRIRIEIRKAALYNVPSTCKRLMPVMVSNTILFTTEIICLFEHSSAALSALTPESLESLSYAFGDQFTTSQYM